MRVGLGQSSLRGRGARQRPAHEPGHDGNGTAKPAADPSADDALELGPVELSQPSAVTDDRGLDDERRVRAAGGPEDRAHYSCVCGYQFEASVSTTVACPNCGAGQAW